MRLRDFDLNAPNLPRMEASEFRYHIRCVMSLFRRHCSGVETEDTWRVWVNCVPKVTHSNIVVSGGVAEVEIEVEDDLASFTRLPDSTKRKKALEYLMCGVRQVAAAKGWSLTPFLKAYGTVVSLNYQNVWVMTKHRKQGAFKGELSCAVDCEQFKATLAIRNKAGNVISETVVLQTKPDELYYAHRLGRLMWVGEKLKLLDKAGKEVGDLVIPKT